MLPGTTNAAIDDQTLAQRSAVVRADTAHRMHAVVAARQQDWHAIDMPDQHTIAGYVEKRYTAGKIGTGMQRVVVGHE